MKRTRRNVLGTASTLTGLMLGAGLVASAESDYPDWDPDTAYNGGDRVIFEGYIWEAQWWTQGTEPDESRDVWERIGPVDDDDDNGDEDDGEDEDDENGEDDDGDSEYPVWDADAVYNDGDRVVHDGSVWEAQWWTQGDEPGTAQWGPWDKTDEEPDPPAVIANVSVSTHSPDPGDVVEFDASASDGDIESYAWELGDGTTASGETVSHSYDDEGTYAVSLTVSDDGGATDSDSTTISVGEQDGISGERMFAPYQGTWGNIVDGTLQADTDRVVLAFVGDGTDDGEVNPGWLEGCNEGSCSQDPLSQHVDEIQTLQDNDIEVWISIGGWEGRTVAADADTAEQAKEGYEEILDTFGVTHLDIDDENASGRTGNVYEVRNEGLALLQEERPEVTVGYTVPAGRNGIENRDYSPARDMVSHAVDVGVDLEYVNIMTMNFNPTTIDIIQSAGEGTVDWLGQVYPNKSEAKRWEMLGVTPEAGSSGITTDTAEAVVDWAIDEGVGLLTFWALLNDDGTYSEIFYEFEQSG